MCACLCASTLTMEHPLFLQVVPILTVSSEVSAAELNTCKHHQYTTKYSEK